MVNPIDLLLSIDSGKNECSIFSKSKNTLYAGFDFCKTFDSTKSLDRVKPWRDTLPSQSFEKNRSVIYLKFLNFWKVYDSINTKLHQIFENYKIYNRSNWSRPNSRFAYKKLLIGSNL